MLERLTGSHDFTNDFRQNSDRISRALELKLAVRAENEVKELVKSSVCRNRVAFHSPLVLTRACLLRNIKPPMSRPLWSLPRSLARMSLLIPPGKTKGTFPYTKKS